MKKYIFGGMVFLFAVAGGWMLMEKRFKAVNMVGGMVRWNAEHRPVLREIKP